MRPIAAVFVALLAHLGVATAGEGALRVAVLPPAGPAAAALIERLRLDGRTEVAAEPDGAAVLWVLPQAGPADIARAAAARARGAGLVVVAGPEGDLSSLGVSRAPAPAAAAAGLSARPGARLGAAIPWRSAPQLRARVLIAGPGDAAVEIAGEGAVLREAPGLVVMGLRPDDPQNAALLRWGYYNYLLHAATCLAAGRAPEPFHAWSAAPVPQRGARAAWVLFILAIWPLSIGAFVLARRAGRRDGDGVITSFFAALQAQGRSSGGDGDGASWARVGFERALGGYFVLTGSLLVFLVPYILVVQFLLPTYVQQFPEVDGMWTSTYEFLYPVWTLFDMGTSVAFVKYFAELRTKDPKEALATVQFYSWWQMLTGALQVTIVGLLGVFYVPRTEYALFSHLVALYALSQWPGVFFMLTFFFQAAQRFDYYTALDLLQGKFLFIIGPVPFILLGRAWGRGDLVYGEALGAVFGTAVGYYLVGVVVLALSYALFRRLRVGLRPLLLVSFGWGTARRMLSFGWKIMASDLLHKISWAVEVSVLVSLLLSYNEAMGIRSMIEYKFYFIFTFLYGWSQAGVASYSEAHGAGKRELLRYHVGRSFQFSHLYCAILFSFLVALSPPFIRGALEPQWAAAASLMLLACLRGLLLPAAWVLDAVLQGCGRPGLCAILRATEQVLRIALFWVLVPRYQLAGVLIGMLLTLALKAVVGWIMINRAVVRLALPPWPTVMAPLLAGAVNWALWESAARLVGGASRPALLCLMVIGGMTSFPLCFFFCGLLGGFDERALAELARGADMASLFRPAARSLLWAARLGARRALLPARYPEALLLAADREAREIEAAEAALVRARSG